LRTVLGVTYITAEREDDIVERTFPFRFLLAPSPSPSPSITTNLSEPFNAAKEKKIAEERTTAGKVKAQREVGNTSREN
jgi:hypothetical protein